MTSLRCHLTRIAALWLLSSVGLHAASVRSITQHDITWTFDKEVPSGQFCNGDYWVVGPVNVVGITTSLHAPGFEPKPGQDGSMLNPGTGPKQGYESQLGAYNSRVCSYDPSLNAALPGGSPVSPQNPLSLPEQSSLVSMVSWLYRSPEDAEPGMPKINGITKSPRSATRSGAVLTVLPSAPPEGSFRPPYAGTNKTVRFNLANLDRSKLKNIPPVPNASSPREIAKKFERTWFDHVNEWLGAEVHPTENMPNYGREIARHINDALLLLNVDYSQLPDAPGKDELLIPLVQLGIDFTGIADNGGYWPANGGHHAGRKLAILFAGVLLNDEHMKNVAKWETRFQDDEQTFFVSQAEVDITHSGEWKPDKRGGEPQPYTKEDIGLAEWGVAHAKNPRADNKLWTTPYRSINNANIIAAALIARIMGLEDAWNHPPFFAYADRVVKDGKLNELSSISSPFALAMVRKYSQDMPKK